jgi:hypothetical protein
MGMVRRHRRGCSLGTNACGTGGLANRFGIAPSVAIRTMVANSTPRHYVSGAVAANASLTYIFQRGVGRAGGVTDGSQCAGAAFARNDRQVFRSG